MASTVSMTHESYNSTFVSAAVALLEQRENGNAIKSRALARHDSSESDISTECPETSPCSETSDDRETADFQAIAKPSIKRGSDAIDPFATGTKLQPEKRRRLLIEAAVAPARSSAAILMDLWASIEPDPMKARVSVLCDCLCYAYEEDVGHAPDEEVIESIAQVAVDAVESAKDIGDDDFCSRFEEFVHQVEMQDM